MMFVHLQNIQIQRPCPLSVYSHAVLLSTSLFAPRLTVTLQLEPNIHADKLHHQNATVMDYYRGLLMICAWRFTVALQTVIKLPA